MSKQKKSFTTLRTRCSFVGAGSGIRTHEGVTPNGCHVNRRISRWDLEAVALTTQPSRRNSPTKTGTSLKPFPASNGIVRSRRTAWHYRLAKGQYYLTSRI